MFSGMTPAVADEAVTSQTAEETTAAEPEAPAEEPAAPAEEAPAEEPAAPAEETPAEETPAEETPAEETPAEETPAEETPAEEPAAPAEEQSPAKGAAPSKEVQQESAVAPLALLACEGWPVAGSPVAGFEIDGNLCLDGDGTMDWATVGGQPVRSDGFDDPEQFDQGASEANHPWSAAQTILNSGSGSAKTDIGDVYAFTQTVGGDVYAYLGFERQVNTGSVSYHVELNQAENDFGPVPTRTIGDLRLTIEQNGNNTIALVGADLWDGDSWESLGSLAGFVGQVNQDVINDLSGDELEAGTFAEAAINLTELFGDSGCSGNFGVLNVRSSQSPSETSSLADWIDPVALNVPSTCSTLTILKTDSNGTPLAGAQFSISPNPTTGTGSTTGTTDATGRIVFSGNVQPGTYTITETAAPPGYLLDTTPQVVTFGDQAESKTVTFVDPLGGVSWLKHDRNGALLGGATFQITATGGAAAAAPWDLDSSPITVVDNGVRDTDPTAGEISVAGLPTGTYSVVETVAPAGYVLDPASKSFTVSQQTPNPTIATAFVNTPYATVTLTKVWVNSFAGDTADIEISGDASADGTSTAPTNGPVIQVSVAPGSALDLAETLGGDNTGLYSSSLSCVGASVTDNTGTAGSIAVPQWPASANGVQCTFTNTAITKTVTLQKRWIDAIAGDTADLTAGTATATSTATGEANQLDITNTAVATVRVGDTITLSEVLNGQGVYGSSYSCTTGAAGAGSTFQLTVPNANVVCTFENEAERATVTLKKAWVDAFAGDTADLDITGDASDSATSTATEGDSVDNVNVASVNVRIGEEVSLAEELGADNTGSYTAAWACDDGTSGQGGSIPEFTVEESVVCTITNTAETIDIVVNKVWIDAFQGDAADLSINGTTETSTADGSANQTDESVVTLTVRVGDDVTVSEVLDGDNRGEYASVYSCSPAGGEGSGTSTTFTAPDADVECTFTNTAIKVGVLLQKRWLGGIALDQARLSILREGIELGANVSLSDGSLDRLDNINTVFAQVRIGEILTLIETVTGDGQYESKYLCTSGVLSGNGEGRLFQLTVTQAAVCVFANRALTQSVSVVKTWVNGQEGDTADLSISGGADGSGQSVADGTVGEFTDAANMVTADAIIGEEVSVSEIIGVQEGDPSDYASSLVCVGADDTVLVDVDARMGTFTMPNQPVDCEFVNEAELPTIALNKVVAVEGADVADTNWQLFATPEEGDTVTDPAGGDVAPTEVPTGVGYDLSEELIGDFAGSDEFEAGEWACVSDIAGPIELTDSVPGSASLGGLDKGENVVCMIVNSHVDQGYMLDKSLVDSVQNEDGTWTVTYEITVHNNSVLVPITYDLTDTLETPATGVTYIGASWTGPTSGDFDLESSLTAQLADDEELAPNDGSNDAVYTVTVDVDVTATPEEPATCDEEGADGIGIVNEATATVGEDEQSDDACGTVHFDDVDIEKTASNLPEGGSVEPGDTFDYVLTVSNNGTRDATDVVVTDAVPDRLEVTNLVLPAGWTNDNGPDFVDADNEISVSTPLLGVGESVQIVVTVEFLPLETDIIDVVGDDEVPAAPTPLDELVNTACVDAERDEIEENNCSTIEIPVREITATLYTRCVADAPFLGWTISKSPALLSEPIEFLWVPDSATPTTEPQLVAMTQPGGTATWSNEIAWPGAEFTPSGVSIDYPGWRPIVASDIVSGSSPTQYYYPGTTDIIAPEDVPDYIFNGLILDDSELDYAWRLGSTVTFTVNPELVFTTEYPPATPECFVARHTEVQIEKTASVAKSEPGASFTYDLAVANVSDDSAAEGVVVTDVIPADLKITDISWPGEGDENTFPNWESCDVTGEDSAGFGGTLECVLFGPLQPVNTEGASSAPTITLAATVDPSATTSVITNVAVVDYHTFGDPDDPGRDSDDATVTLSQLPATGGGDLWPLAVFGFLTLLAGAATLIVVRRRRGEAKPVL